MALALVLVQPRQVAWGEVPAAGPAVALALVPVHQACWVVAPVDEEVRCQCS